MPTSVCSAVAQNAIRDGLTYSICSPRDAEYVPEHNARYVMYTDADVTTLTDYAIQNNLTPFISMQNHHSLVYREEEREMFPTLKVRPAPLLSRSPCIAAD